MKNIIDDLDLLFLGSEFKQALIYTKNSILVVFSAGLLGSYIVDSKYLDSKYLKFERGGHEHRISKYKSYHINMKNYENVLKNYLKSIGVVKYEVAQEMKNKIEFHYKFYTKDYLDNNK